MRRRLLEAFKKLYGNDGDIRVYFAPGRVNLIGEHTDYNGGHVFPCALTFGTYGVARKRSDRKFRFFSKNFEAMGVIECGLDGLAPSAAAKWTNYPKGVIWAFGRRGYKMEHGMDILIYGDIPNGSGLSSSASVEVLMGLMVKDMFGLDQVSMIDIALIGQEAENNFIGCSCGIMDQFASAMGRKGHAIFLDTNTLRYEYAPVELKNARLIIANSKVKHSLVDSAYNDRRNECETALKELQCVLDIQALGELTEAEFEANINAVGDPALKRRARHAVYENQRTIRAWKALKDHDLLLFGELMNASHASLRDDYEVSCREVNILVELAQTTPGVIGSRMTGGGFGGCTVNIVEQGAVERFTGHIGRVYREKTGIEAEFYVVDIGDGARKVLSDSETF